MNWRVMLCLPLLLLLVGCKDPQTRLPPLFNVGDIVKITSSSQVGFITEVHGNDGWTYCIRFKDISLNYVEKEIKLIEKFDWNKYASKPEIDLGLLKEQK